MKLRMMRSTPPLALGLGLSVLLLAGCKPSNESPKSLSQAKPASNGGQIQLTGAGATFPFPLYSKWFEEYEKVDPNVQINYQAIGSGAGQKQILSRTVDFGASDAPMTDASLAQAPSKLLHIPTVAGAVVVTYNLAGNPTLKLDGPTLADIFRGKITQWNDPRITKLNPGLALPKGDILVVHRSDGSGTSFIFTSYLSAVSPEWKSQVGASTAVKWPVGLGGKGNQGVSGLVKQTPGSIGYVELIYALQNHLPFASLKNADGRYIVASLAAVTAAMGTAHIPDDFRFSVINAHGEKAYPISGATWLLVYQKQSDPQKGKELVQFLHWALTDGQKLAPALNYAPLPQSLQQRALARLKTIQF